MRNLRQSVVGHCSPDATRRVRMLRRSLTGRRGTFPDGAPSLTKHHHHKLLFTQAVFHWKPISQKLLGRASRLSSKRTNDLITLARRPCHELAIVQKHSSKHCS